MPATVDTAAHEVKVEGDDVLVRICQPGDLAQRAPQQLVNSPAVVTKAVERISVAPAVGGFADHSHPSRPTAAESHAIGAINEDRVREEPATRLE